MKKVNVFQVFAFLSFMFLAGGAQAANWCPSASSLPSFSTVEGKGLPKKGLAFITTDSDGGIYVAASSGVFMSDDQGETFSKITAVPQKLMASLLPYNGKLYVGGTDGMFGVYDISTKSFKQLRRPDYHPVTSIKSSSFKPGLLYVAVYGGGLQQYNTEASDWLPLSGDDWCDFVDGNVRDTHQANGHLYVASNVGMCAKDMTADGGHFKTIPYKTYVGSDQVNNEYVQPRSLSSGADGTLYFTSQRVGLWAKPEDDVMFGKVFGVFDKPETNQLGNLYIDPDPGCGACYVATQGQGVAVGYRGCGAINTYFSTEHGLASNDVRHIHHSKYDDRLYVVTSEGLSVQAK